MLVVRGGAADCYPWQGAGEWNMLLCAFRQNDRAAEFGAAVRFIKELVERDAVWVQDEEDEAQGQLFTDPDQMRQWRRDIDAMSRRLDELDDEEAREIAAITDRYADVKPHTTAAAVVFALTRADADGWVE